MKRIYGFSLRTPAPLFENAHDTARKRNASDGCRTFDSVKSLNLSLLPSLDSLGSGPVRFLPRRLFPHATLTKPSATRMSETGISRDIEIINVDPVVVLPSNDPRLPRARAPGRFYRAAFQFSCPVYATVSVPPFTERATNVTIAPMDRNGCIL